MRAVILVSCFVLAACVNSDATPQASAQASDPAGASAQGTPAPRTSLRTVALGNGLVLDVPATWAVADGRIVNRATQRLVLVGNGDLNGLPTIPGNGDVDAALLPDGRVVVAIQSFCRLACYGPDTETRLPLDWGTAGQLGDRSLPAGRHELAVGFRWFDQPLFLIARWADDATASDVAAIAAIVRSIRADPAPPARGEYDGWAGLGPVSDIPIGTVRLVPLPPGAVVRPAFRTTDNVPFFVVRGRQNLYAFASRPLADQRCEITYSDVSDRFSCAVDGRTYEWTRFGRYLGPEPASDLAQHRVVVREGIVWVRYVESALLLPSVRDEAAER